MSKVKVNFYMAGGHEILVELDEVSNPNDACKKLAELEVSIREGMKKRKEFLSFKTPNVTISVAHIVAYKSEILEL